MEGFGMNGQASNTYAMVSSGHQQHGFERKDTFFVLAYTGMSDALQILDPNGSVEWHGPNSWNPKATAEAIRGLIEREVQGIIINATDDASLIEAINEAVQSNIPIITLDADSQKSERLAFIGTNNYQAGYLAGQTMSKWLDGQGDIAIATIKGAPHLAERIRGFRDALAQDSPACKIHLIPWSGNILMGKDQQIDDSEFQIRCLSTLKHCPEIRGIFVDHGCRWNSIAHVFDQWTFKEPLHVLTFDFNEDLLKLMFEEDKIKATIGQDPYIMGYVAMLLAYYGQHAPTLPSNHDGSWRVAAIKNFISHHSTSISQRTLAKLHNILNHLDSSSSKTASTPILINAVVLGKHQPLDILTDQFAHLSHAIFSKIESLSKEIVERRKAQEDFKRINKELEKRVKECTQELVERQRTDIKERYRFEGLIGKSAPMQRIYKLIVSGANSDVNTLLIGESGTGKELIAQAFHQVSPRRKESFIAVNCASIPESLFEREFFGHQKGTFTGADCDKPGFFDRANKGILFLDEFTELTPGMQAKLLRVLQNGEYTPLGSTHPKQSDVLIIAATNVDCQKEIEEGRLRQDFFYRIAVIEIQIPPLRMRKDDLPLLIDHFLELLHQKKSKSHHGELFEMPMDLSMLPGELVQALYAYDWPGNVRELQNILLRYRATQDVNVLLPQLKHAESNFSMVQTMAMPNQINLPEAIKSYEKKLINDVLSHNHRNTRKTAAMLGIPLTTLYYKIKTHGMEAPPKS